MFQPLVKGYMIVAARKKVTFEREKQNKEKSSKSSHYQFQTGFFSRFLKSQAHISNYAEDHVLASYLSAHNNWQNNKKA